MSTSYWQSSYVADDGLRQLQNSFHPSVTIRQQGPKERTRLWTAASAGTALVCGRCCNTRPQAFRVGFCAARSRARGAIVGKCGTDHGAMGNDARANDDANKSLTTNAERRTFTPHLHASEAVAVPPHAPHSRSLVSYNQAASFCAR